MENLKNKIKEYQQKYGDKIISYKNWHAEYIWKFELMKDVGAISVETREPYGTAIRVVFRRYDEFKEKYKQIMEQNAKYNQNNAFKQDMVDVTTLDL